MVELVLLQVQAPNSQRDDPDQSKHTFMLDIPERAAA